MNPNYSILALTSTLAPFFSCAPLVAAFMAGSASASSSAVIPPPPPSTVAASAPPFTALLGRTTSPLTRSQACLLARQVSTLLHHHWRVEPWFFPRVLMDAITPHTVLSLRSCGVFDQSCCLRSPCVSWAPLLLTHWFPQQ